MADYIPNTNHKLVLIFLDKIFPAHELGDFTVDQLTHMRNHLPVSVKLREEVLAGLESGRCFIPIVGWRVSNGRSTPVPLGEIDAYHLQFCVIYNTESGAVFNILGGSRLPLIELIAKDIEALKESEKILEARVETLLKNKGEPRVEW